MKVTRVFETSGSLTPLLNLTFQRQESSVSTLWKLQFPTRDLVSTVKCLVVWIGVVNVRSCHKRHSWDSSVGNDAPRKLMSITLNLGTYGRMHVTVTNRGRWASLCAQRTVLAVNSPCLRGALTCRHQAISAACQGAIAFDSVAEHRTNGMTDRLVGLNDPCVSNY